MDHHGITSPRRRNDKPTKKKKKRNHERRSDMPCTDGGPSREQQAEARLNERTDQLCTVLRLVEGHAPRLLKELPEPLQHWWNQHCHHDLREATETARALLADPSPKLTPGERDAMQRLIELAHRAK
jgi:hypothetical protein